VSPFVPTACVSYPFDRRLSVVFSSVKSSVPIAVPPLSPYTTLFRSPALPAGGVEQLPAERDRQHRLAAYLAGHHLHRAGQGDDRSEEHTSELQSHLNLVCRLLLEKKYNTQLCDY